MKPSLIEMRGVEGPNKVSKKITKGWHDKRMRKEYDIGDKMLMNSSSKESFKQIEKITTQVIYPSSQGVTTLQ
jgi:hypothetical protein